MARFENLSVVDALERALSNAKHLRAVHSAHVAAARALARRIDSLDADGFVDESGKLDNVSLPSFLKYLDALGLSVAAPAKSGAVRPSAPADEVGQMRRKLMTAK